MFRIITLIATLGILVGCVPTIENMKLSEVFPKVQGVQVTIDPENRVYRDDWIDTTWSLGRGPSLTFSGQTRVNFVLKNVSNSTIKVMWDESAYIDPDGNSHRIGHSGIKYNKIEESQVSSVVAYESQITDFVIPIENVLFDKQLGWQEMPLFRKNPIGGKISVVLCLANDKDKRSYKFTFVLPASEK